MLFSTFFYYKLHNLIMTLLTYLIIVTLPVIHESLLFLEGAL